jgi:hypothetical protein
MIDSQKLHRPRAPSLSDYFEKRGDSPTALQAVKLQQKLIKDTTSQQKTKLWKNISDDFCVTHND